MTHCYQGSIYNWGPGKKPLKMVSLRVFKQLISKHIKKFI